MRRQLIVEADGGSRGNPGPAAFGALVRDPDTGDVLAETAEALGVATNNVAEYRGLIAGLRAAREIDPEAFVEARLDSKLVVEQMSGRWKMKNADLRRLALEARRVFPPGRVTYVWVPRSRNAAADRLVNAALDGDLSAADQVPGQVQEPEPTEPPNRLVGWAAELGVPTRLVLVRHGQTALTAAKRFSGSDVEGPPLDADGREQAERAGRALVGSEAVAVVTSPMLRARETAQIIGAELGIGVDVDEGWRECAFGKWEGLTFAEVGERYPAELAAWLSSTEAAPPDGEPLDAMERRVGEARDRVLARYPGQGVVVVTHSMPVRAMVRLGLGAPAEAMFRMQPAPGSITELHVYADGTTSLVAFSHVR
ncbi:MAG: bifunctional RNase H/acid phosphatase [Jiangellaceae bacterium]